MPRNTTYEPLLMFQPIGGVNSEDNPSMIADQELQSSRNFLFERGQAITRPGLASLAVTGCTGSDVNLGWLFSSLMFEPSTPAPYPLSPLVLGLGNLGQTLYSGTLSPLGLGLTALTPPAGVTLAQKGTPAQNYYDYMPQAGVVNGAMLVGGLVMTGTGIARYIPNDTSWTQITGVNPVFIVGVLSRGFGALDWQAANAGQITVEWSVAGDETTWTGATNGSGSAILTDAADGITGLGVVNGTVVIPRFTGIHLGIETGQAFPAFRFVNYNGSTDIGCYFPGTFTVSNNICYFVGKDNVYTFDTINPPVPIGYKIRSLLLNAINSMASTGNSYVGFVSMGQSLGLQPSANLARARYNLVPVGPSTAGLPHFVYDILSGTWSVHVYGLSWNFAAPSVVAQGYTYPTTSVFLPLLKSGISNCSAWDETAALETTAILVSKTFRPGAYDRDYALRRLLMSWSQPYNAAAVNVSIAVQGTLNGALIKHTKSTSLQNTSASAPWFRDWFLGLADTYGQDFIITISPYAGGQLSIDFVGLEISESGGLRAEY